MPKTKNNRKKNGTMKAKSIHCCEHTFHGIQHWYKSKFEKLGWMILAQKYGYTDKISEYKSSLMRLKQSIEHKLTHIKDSDKKQDLKIMHNNVTTLISHVNNDFK